MRALSSVYTAALLLICAPSHAWAGPDAHERTAAQTASLLRLAAGVDDAIDVYRLALLELVPTLRKLCDVATQPGTEPTSQLPPETAAVFGTPLQRGRQPGVGQRATGDHAGLSRRSRRRVGTLGFGQKACSKPSPPTRALLRAVEHIAGAADEVIDLYTRERPRRRDGPVPRRCARGYSGRLGRVGAGRSQCPQSAVARPQAGRPLAGLHAPGCGLGPRARYDRCRTPGGRAHWHRAAAVPGPDARPCRGPATSSRWPA